MLKAPIRKRKPQKYFPKIGQVFGKMTLVEIIPPDEIHRYTRHKCRCKCGTEKYIEVSRLYSGRVISCGCLSKQRASLLGKRNRLRDGNSTENALLNKYKYAARKRGLPFSLSKEESHNLFLGNCFYCDTPPYRTVKYESCASEFTYNGIDRIDNSIGYTAANCVSCCTTCNKSKNSMSISNFLEWVEKVYIHSIKNKGEFKP